MLTENSFCWREEYFGYRHFDADILYSEIKQHNGNDFHIIHSHPQAQTGITEVRLCYFSNIRSCLRRTGFLLDIIIHLVEGILEHFLPLGDS